MKVEPTRLPGVVVVAPVVHRDDRGYFVELWSAKGYSDLGLPASFVQVNLSFSGARVLRGLHLQHPHGQGKLVGVVQGEVFDVVVDARVGSTTFGQWTAERLSADNARQLYIPPGFAHGFCVTSETAVLVYKCTEPYHRESELGVRWDDPDLGIPWPFTDPVLSPKDAALGRLSEIPCDRLPQFGRTP